MCVLYQKLFEIEPIECTEVNSIIYSLLSVII
jgi:hypothetical protein